MSELSKNFNPAQVEPEIAQRWKNANAFHATPGSSGKPYAIVIPPPNVTAALHMGHALNNTLQDILIRWHRMLGDNAMWMPGTDHAGIATQTVVDKRLQAEGQPALAEHKQMELRGEGGREKFIAKVQAWKDEYEQRITDQLIAMGCSCDWQRQRFTMDEQCAKAVREAFYQLFKDGLIYRGKRLVNWDPATQTALADDEVENKDIDGSFWYMKYPLVDDHGKDTGEFVTVATTRPETMLGDTAVAVNPDDPPRAVHIGKKVRLPIVNRIIPVIGDDYVVKPDPDSSDEKAKYASGYLKVTPAHDPNDYEIGLRNDLPMINVMAPDATISKDFNWADWDDCEHDPFINELLGKDRYEARKLIVDWFKQHDLLEDVRPYRHSVGHSYRSHVAIEPYLSDQWYVKVTDEKLAGAALNAMALDQRDGDATVRGDTPRLADGDELRFYPSRYAKTFQGWHENIRDWCISRQLWWGHRIPVWTRDADIAFDVEPTPVKGHDNDARLITTLDRGFGSDFDQTLARFPVHYCLTANPHPTNEKQIRFQLCLDRDEPSLLQQLEANGWEQDPDVLDTWFSSALWPLSTLGWPDETDELKTWNPTNLLCTAREIITLWVSRMVMFNLYFRGQLPFRDVFIHAMIQDGEGRKMSKSLGNGVDPLDIIHSHGADAMRFTLAEMTTNTQDVRLPVQRDETTGRNTSPKFDIGRNFATKLWNAVRFALGNLSNSSSHQAQGGKLTTADRWLLSRLARVVAATDTALASYEFSNYARTVREFFWNDLCDWYIEAVKPTISENAQQQQVLATALDVVLRLLHPMMPFISEALWSQLNAVMPQRHVDGIEAEPHDLLILAAWPKVDAALIDEQVEADFALLQEAIGAMRQARVAHQVPPRQRIACSAKAPPAIAQRMLAMHDLVQTLANVDAHEVGPHVDRPANAASVYVADAEIYLHDLVDPDAERTRISKQIDAATRSVEAMRKRLANKNYVDKAPAHLVEESRAQLADAERDLKALQDQLLALG